MRSYAYHSDDPRFPGSIEEQKRQFQDAVWFASPARVEQRGGKFAGAGGRLLGVMPNGDLVQEHAGVLVLITTTPESWDEKAFRIDMDRVKRASYLKANRRQRNHVDISSRITGDRDE